MNYPALGARGFLLPTRLKNSYEGAGQGRRASNWKVSGAGPAATSTNGLQTLRNRSRHAIRNDPYAFTVVDKPVSNHIGTGIVPKPTHNDETIRSALRELWGDFTEESDADGQLDFYGQQALAGHTFFGGGEVFARLRVRPLSDGLAVPLQVQLLEPEFVPHTKNGRAPGTNNPIRQGIEFEGTKRVAYWMYKRHPGEGSTDPSYNELVRVPADEVLHLHEPTRAGQLRGVPLLAPVLLRLKTLDEFDDAVAFRQEVANLFAGFIRKTPSQSPFPTEGGSSAADAGYSPLVGLEPGTMQELGPDEDVIFSDPPDAGNNYAEFMRQQLSAVAVGAGLPFELLSGDLRGVSDRIIRIILNEFRRRVEQRQHAIFVHQFCRPVYQRFVSLAWLSGAILLPDFASNPRPYLRARWVPQGWAYTHPVQDVQADKMAVRAGFTSRSAVQLRRGEDPDTIDRENMEDNARADRMGLTFATDPRQRDDQGEVIEDKT